MDARTDLKPGVRLQMEDGSVVEVVSTDAAGRTAQATCIESPFDVSLEGKSIVVSVDDVIAVVSQDDMTRLN
jgi:hypothetical protein